MTFDAVVVLTLSDEQLAVIEQRRAGSDLRLMLDANVVLGYDPAASSGDQNARWPARSFQENLYIFSDTWQRLLNLTALATSLAVVVPVPLDSSAAAKVGTHLRDAIRKVSRRGVRRRGDGRAPCHRQHGNWLVLREGRDPDSQGSAIPAREVVGAAACAARPRQPVCPRRRGG